MYEKIQRDFMVHAPYVMLFEQVEVAAHRANVHGLTIGVTSEFDRYAGIAKQ
jgi:peptide/nickel transport system substrate-binding protein